MYKCERCRRALKSSPWREMGIGKICAQKKRAAGGFDRPPTELEPLFDGSNDVLVRRTYDGLLTNVRQQVVQHSPTGFEIGYPGSGPADFALNILCHFFPTNNQNDVQCFAGRVSRQAWDFHQSFKFDLIATMPRLEVGQSHVLPVAAIRNWITRKEQMLAEQPFSFVEEF